MQAEIIQSILLKNDTLALLPTGGGKSVCFQIPALSMDGICLVVSPLIALIKDQVENLVSKGIPALAVHAGMSFMDVKKTLQNAAFGNYKFLYLSPERLHTDLFAEFLPSMKISLIAVDEAHCISQWGYDFRPAYLNIALLREQLPGVPVIALTASATLDVQNDICEKLLFGKTSQRFQQSFERPNLSYSVFQPAAKQNKLVEILTNVKGTAIVYCKSRKQTQKISDLLKMHGINADYYHAGLDTETRNSKQEKWIKNTVQVMVCTNAFGMGIDKPDVRVVVHFEVPDCLENYYQEAGRAGRDGKRSYAVLLHGGDEIDNLFQQVEQRFPDVVALKTCYINLMNHLQVAGGMGEGQSYTLDIGIFASCFNMNAYEAGYAIQALAKDKLFYYDEQVFTPSTAVFITDKNHLFEFEKMHPELEPLVKGLLRMYEGIFDYPASVNEYQIGNFLKKNATEVKKELLMLHAYSIIEYKPQNEKPQIFLLQSRMYSDDFKFNIHAHLARKKRFADRIKAIEEYITDKNQCRSSVIAVYFNDSTVRACGICDNCINNKNKQKGNNFSDELLLLIKNSKQTVKELEGHFTDKKSFWNAINYLQAEEIIESDNKGFISLKEIK